MIVIILIKNHLNTNSDEIPLVHLGFLFFILSCNNPDIDESLLGDSVDVSETENVKGAVEEFGQMLSDHSGTAGTKSTGKAIELTLTDSTMIKHTGLKSRSNKSITDSIVLYTFDMEVDGKHGFAIASGHDSMNKVNAYVEQGNISDTAFIPGMAEMISDIPAICKQDLIGLHETKGVATRSGTTLTFCVPDFIETAWKQTLPYNLKLPTNGACSSTYYPVGCVAVAAGQVIAYYGQCNQAFDFPLLTAQKYIYPWSNSTLQNEVSNFLKYVAEEVDSEYGCLKTGSTINKAEAFLNACGYSYDYDATSDVTANKLFWSIIRFNPVISRGVSADGGHEWIFDGLYGTCQLASPTTLNSINTVHCNWGWGGTSNGWYAFNGSKYNMPSTVPSDDPSVPSDVTGSTSNYYRQNKYIYLKQRTAVHYMIVIQQGACVFLRNA